MPQGERPAICAICGKRVAEIDLAPELARLPASGRLPIHAACFQSYVKESRARGEAWARSPRGRWTLGWLRVRLVGTVLLATILTVVAAGPVALVLAVRGTRLRRAVVSALLGESRAVVIVGHRPSTGTAADIRDIFSASWGASSGVVVLLIDIDAPFAKTDLARAAWEHWGSDPKPPRQQSVVVIPRHGAVKCLRIGHSFAEAGTPWRDRLLQVQEHVQALLEQATRDVQR